MQLNIRIENYEQIRDILMRGENPETYRGVYSDVIRDLLREGRDIAEEVTHRWTGTLARSHLWEYDTRHQRGSIFIDPSAVSPTGERPVDYGPIEEARGGSHSFYQITMRRLDMLMPSGMSFTVSRLGSRIEGGF